MASETEIANLALSHLGNGTEIADLETERSSEASACRRFYDVALAQVFRDYAWPFATQTAALALVTERDVDTDHPTAEWLYQYALPANCMMLRKLQSGLRVDPREMKVPYQLHYGTSGTTVLTDMVDAVGVFTLLVEDAGRYPPDFTLAFSALLAALVAPRITGGDPFKQRQVAMAVYSDMIAKARANSANEEQPDVEPEGGYTRARD